MKNMELRNSIKKDQSISGFLRNDGRIGIRNHLAVWSASVCSNPLVDKLTGGFKGKIVPLKHSHGCCQIGTDFKRTQNVLERLADHPNVGGILLVSLGCEETPFLEIEEKIKQSGKPVRLLVIQKSGNTLKAFKEGILLIKSLKREMKKKLNRVKTPLTGFTIGLECGASDTTSGIAANPVLGWVSDCLVESGNTVILSETTELIGAEHVFKKRIIDRKMRMKFLNMVKTLEDRIDSVGVDIRGSQPTPGNIAGGLSSIEEKSLGNVSKAGNSIVQEVIGYGERPTKKGLVFMDTPGQDVESLTGMAAGGAHLFLFSTGQGSPIGFPIVPVIKITANPTTFLRMRNDIDINVGTIIEGTETLDEAGNRVLSYVYHVCNGLLTKAEKNRYFEMSIYKDEITL